MVSTANAVGCATARTACPPETELVRHVYSGGAEAEWCRRPDGVREGPEVRYYESGSELASGGYVDGALDGVWRYRWTDGHNWRADRWQEGALLSKTLDPASAHLSASELDRVGWTSSGIIKLTSADPLLGRTSRDRPGATVAAHHPNGQPRLAGQYDGEGLRTGVWRWWYADGHPAQEMGYLAGVREGSARAWHPNGMPAADGVYRAGEREGRWRWWDPSGRWLGESLYEAGRKISGGVMVSP